MYWQNWKKLINNNKLKILMLNILIITLLTISLTISPADSQTVLHSQITAGEVTMSCQKANDFNHWMNGNNLKIKNINLTQS